jgi:hypothetical protein
MLTNTGFNPVRVRSTIPTISTRSTMGELDPPSDLMRLYGSHGPGVLLVENQVSPSFRVGRSGGSFGEPVDELVDEQIDVLRRKCGDMRQNQAVGQAAQGRLGC